MLIALVSLVVFCLALKGIYALDDWKKLSPEERQYLNMRERERLAQLQEMGAIVVPVFAAVTLVIAVIFFFSN